MLKSPDESLESFEEISNINIKNLSESDTRCKIIDSIFINVLGWEEKNITREENSDSGFVDYIFSNEGINFFILEAKKGEINFQIPDNFKNREYKISGIISKEKNLISAIEQTQKYCVDKGVQFGIVSNGYQFILFEAIKIGSPWKEGKCVVFNGFEEIIKNFIYFYNLLNKEALIKGSIKKKFLATSQSLTFSRPIDEIINKDANLNRNTLHSYVSPFIDFVFGDLISETQINILEKCYISDKIDDTGKCFKQIFHERTPFFISREGVRGILETECSGGIFQKEIELRKLNGNGELVLLLGGVGTGKTTFIHRLFNIILKQKQNHYWFYVDFKISPTDEDSIENFIYQHIYENYESKYKNKVEKLMRDDNLDIFKNSEPKLKDEYISFLSNLFSYLKLKGGTVTLVLDNVDRCVEKVQEKIFLESQHITNKYMILTILSLREESYYKSKLTGSFDAYHIKKFNIIPPTIEKMLHKRLKYILELLSKEDNEISLIMDKNIDFQGRKKDIIIFFETIKFSLERKNPKYSTQAIHFISQISDGNMREGLEMFKNFLSSGNTKVQDIIDVYNSGGQYFIPEYQFLKSIILPNTKYYHGEKSHILNLFDIDTNLTQSHFLHLRVLNFLFINKSNESQEGRGFISIDYIFQEANRVNLSKESIEYSLKVLMKFGLIKNNVEDKTDLENCSYIKITPKGGYYLTSLVKKFTYLDIIKFDTQISDKNLAKIIRSNAEEEGMVTRLDIAYKFLEYLLRMEIEEKIHNPEYSQNQLTSRNFMEKIIEDFNKDRKYILNKRVKTGN